MLRTPTENMRQMYESRRLDTLRKIDEAITDLQEMGQIVTKQALMKRTGLSSATFSKPHVKELLERRAVCQYAERTVILQEKAEREGRKEADRLRRENDRLRNKNRNLEDEVTHLRRMLEKRMMENANLRGETERLRGKYQLCLERMESAGIIANPPHITPVR